MYNPDADPHNLTADSDSEGHDSDNELDSASDNKKKRVEKRRKNEGTMQWNMLDYFASETCAYAKLAHLQGRCPSSSPTST